MASAPAQFFFGEDNGEGEEHQNLSSDESSGSEVVTDSDLEEVFAEWADVILGEPHHRNKVAIHSDFFWEGSSANTTGEGQLAVLFDARPPPRNQIIGATPEYVEYLRNLPPEEIELFPEFTLEETFRPSNMFWNYPRAVTDYTSIEGKMTAIIPSGGVKKLICKEGREEESLQVGNNVLINYYIYVEGYSYCVDSNKPKMKPHSFVLGRKRGGIPVLDLGTLSMKVKEVAAFVATPEYGYGRLGLGPWVPGDKRVLCIIEVLAKLASPSDSSSILNMVPEERRLLPFEEIYTFSSQLKAEGNKNLNKMKNARALRKYLQAATCLEDATPRDDHDDKAKVELMHNIYSNVCVTSFRVSQFGTAAQFAEKAIQLPVPERVKGMDYFRCAKALYCERKCEQAQVFIDRAVQLLPESGEVKELETYIRMMLGMSEEKMERERKEHRKRNSYCGTFLHF